MENYSIEQLEELLTNAYALRKQAYKVRAPKFMITSLNDQITEIRFALVEKGN
jgi:hypothetical protein